MNDSVTIVLRGEPTAVRRPRFAKNGVAYTPAKTRNSLAPSPLVGTDPDD